MHSENISHGSISLQNILLDALGTVKIVDFSKSTQIEKMTFAENEILSYGSKNDEKRFSDDI